MSQERLIPALRFPEFSSNWNPKRLCDVFDLMYGKDHKGLPNGKIPVLGSGGVMRYVDQALYDQPSVLIGRKGTIDKPIYIDEPFWTVDTLFYTKIKKEYVPFFIYLLAKNIQWKKYNEATGVPSLNTKGINGIPVVLTCINEQKKIADFLSSVDKKISQLKEKKTLLQEYKKGVMQQLFSQQIRFKDDDENAFPDWQEIRISELLKLQLNSIKMLDNEEYELITVRRRNGGVDSRGLYKGKDVLVKTQFELKENQFVISKRQIVHGACGVVPANLKGAIVSNEYNVFNPVPAMVDIHFFNLFSKTMPMKKAYFINSDGVHIEKLLFKTKSWLKTKVIIPCVDEQKKIVRFIGELDKKIDQVAEQIEQTEQFKKGLLQQMFV
ncbi:MAG: restriction endonuclease subunit S [Deltaproteobacteria bacterium]|nr:restriction endonuclease subunit S [Deltaproteobacteria bacterium]